MKARRAGFTLLELLTAAALFSILGVMLFQMVRSAMDVWGTGERNRELYERATTAFDLLATDLRDGWAGTPSAGQPAELLCTWRAEDLDQDGRPDRFVPLLRFTRLCHEERSLEWLARAGDTAGGEQAVTGLQPQDSKTLRPTGGLAESLYTTVQRTGAALPSLVRSVRAPAGGERSLLDPELADKPDRLAQGSSVVIDDVLFFGVEFWGPATRGWEPDGGALSAWDSTRGVLPPGDTGFPYGVAGSLGDTSDDVWPRLIRLTLVLDRSQGATTAGKLADPVGADGRRIKLAGAALLHDEQTPEYLLVEQEWMGVMSIEGDEVAVRRGARGSVAAAHSEGATVRAGRSFHRVLELPVGRELLLPEDAR
jgi:prepilin-type N-terminal cleavage/methylation domain-containing protein